MPAVAAAALAVLAVAAPGSAHARGFEPGADTAKVDNPWLPLKPGVTLVYTGVKDGRPTRDVFGATKATRTIAGVRCVAVRDRLYSRGRLIERTTDYYAQDRHGTVWYFGEDTAELDAKGRVKSTEGTWHAGVDGARAGIFMPSHPRVGERHRQEYYKAHAEDHFSVASLHARISVPYGSFRNVLETREWTPLEPGVLDAKHYVRGIGEVSEVSLKGPKETLELVSVR
ncbi:MAG: hypothetical protein ACJ76V_12700 [Thermoleophilaceae bacterium]